MNKFSIEYEENLISLHFDIGLNPVNKKLTKIMENRRKVDKGGKRKCEVYERC